MFKEINKDWMDEYEFTYQKYKQQWDYHYQEVRRFLLSCIPDKVESLGFVGVTSKIPELDSPTLDRIDEIILLDLYEEGMFEAKDFLKSKFSYEKVQLETLDITFGFVELIAEYFQEFDVGQINEDELFSKLSKPEYSYTEYTERKFDFIVHMGIMDYYLMPLFVHHCPNFMNRCNEFFEIMKKLNDTAVTISLKAMFSMLSNDGHLVISSPITREPEGKECDRSLFWIKSLEEHIIDTEFDIVKKSKHIWDEFPEKNGHSHEILNVYCKKRKR